MKTLILSCLLFVACSPSNPPGCPPKIVEGDTCGDIYHFECVDGNTPLMCWPSSEAGPLVWTLAPAYTACRIEPAVKPLDTCTDAQAGGRRCDMEAFQTCDGAHWQTHNRSCTRNAAGNWVW